MNACGLANYVVIPRPPPDRMFLLVKDSPMKDFNSNVRPSSLPDTSVATADIRRQRQSIAAAEQMKRNSGEEYQTIRYDPEKKLWYDPALRGWSANKPAGATTANTVIVEPLPDTDDVSVLVKIKYDPTRQMWFDPVRGGWSSTKPARATNENTEIVKANVETKLYQAGDDRIPGAPSSSTRTTTTASSASSAAASSSNGVKYDAARKMWFDPVRGGWTSTKPANAPAGMGP